MKKFIQSIRGFFAKPNVKQSLPLAEKKRTYIDPITGDNDMVVVFKDREVAGIAGHILKEKNINSSWFDRVRYVQSKDIEQINKLMGEHNIQCEIKPIKWMSVEEAIDRTISAVQKKRAVSAKGNVA